MGDLMLEYLELMVNSIAEDPVTSRLQEKLNVLINDFYRIDSDGKLHANTYAFRHMRKILLPVLAERLKYVGIPKILVKDESMDAAFDNLAISFYKILPTSIEIKTDTDTSIGMKHITDDLKKKSQGHIDIFIYDVKFAFKDVKFSMDRHKMPKVKSSGTMDISTKKNKGVSFVLKYNFFLHEHEGRKVPNLEVKQVIIKDMPGLKVHFHKDAEHHTLLNFAATVGAHNIKRKMKNTLAKEVSKLAETIAKHLNHFFSRASDSATKKLPAGKAIKEAGFKEKMVAENTKKSP